MDVARLRQKGATIHEWPDACSTEERIFLDVPWEAVRILIDFANKHFDTNSIKDSINQVCQKDGLEILADLSLSAALDTPSLRRAIGKAADANGWYKDIARGERLAEVIMTAQAAMTDTPSIAAIAALRQWVDA